MSTVAPVAHGESPAPGTERPPSSRLLSLDAARGLAIVVMLLAMHPGPNRADPSWLKHPEWHGLSFVDLFFPLFLVAVGVSMTLSDRAQDTGYVLRRAGLLFLIGVALSTLKHEHLALTGVLQHIAVAYLVAFAILRAPRRWHVPLAAALLGAVTVGYVLWAWGSDPWGQSGTLAHAVDGAVLGGYTTEGVVQTVTSAATVVGGGLAGHLVHDLPDRRRLVRALAAGAVALIALGVLLHPIVPINKRLWTPSFAILSTGASWAFLAIGVQLIDVARRRRLAAPLIHLGRNPIAVYVVFMAALALLNSHAAGLFPEVATVAGSAVLGSLAYGVVWTALGWLFAYVLYRRRILIKI